MTVPIRPEVTPLPPAQLGAFAAWLKRNGVTDLDNPDSHYDYRGAFMAGIEGRSANGHWPDTFKQHGHPTFSVESQYSTGVHDGGHWEGDRFQPEESTPWLHGWLSGQPLAADQAPVAADATRVSPALPLPPQATIGPLAFFNRNQPDLSAHVEQPGVQYTHGDMRDLITGNDAALDFLPVLGAARGVYQGAKMAKQGHPLAGAALLAASVLPEGGGLAKKGITRLADEAVGDLVKARYTLPSGDEASILYKADGPVLNVGFMGSTGGEGSLGPSTVKNLFQDIIKNHPNVERIRFNDISGAKAGSGVREIPVPGRQPTAPESAGPVRERFGLAGEKVDGRTVRAETPNLSSISASFNHGEYDVLPGVREVQLSEFPEPPAVTKRSKDLAQQIKASGEINPLIVVDAADGKGPYILEGSNRYDALKILGAKSFPAVVVREKRKLTEETLDALAQRIRDEGPPGTVFEPFIAGTGEINLSKIQIPESARGQGAGSKAMQTLLDYADEVGATVALDPRPDRGKKAALLRFYRRLGFIPASSSRGYNPGSSGEWYRPPRKAK